MSEANKRTIRFVREEAMRKGMLDRLDGLYTDDYVYHGIPMLGDLRGPAGFKELASGFIDAVAGFQETVEDLSRVKLEQFRTIATADIIESLRPGQSGALRTKADGTALEGRHRLVVLRERGIDIDVLPREVLPHEPQD